jgi:GTP-binding protein
VALNKIDLPEVQERWPKIEAELKQRGVARPVAISGLQRKNLGDVLLRSLQLLAEAPEIEPEEEVPIYRLDSDPHAFTISHEPRGWRVSGEAIVRAAAMTYWEYDESTADFSVSADIGDRGCTAQGRGTGR